MSKIGNRFSKRKTRVSKKLLDALESAQLPEDVVEQIISFLSLVQESKIKKEMTSEIALIVNSHTNPAEILANMYNRLDDLNERAKEQKSRVDTVNHDLQKLAYFR